jgi:hypothetical protein
MINELWYKLAAVALANKMARIVWAMMATGVSVSGQSESRHAGGRGCRGRLTRLPVTRVQRELQEMMIGRSDERGNPRRATATQGRIIVVVSFAEPIWASGHRVASKAEHMTAVAPFNKSSSRPLHPRGRPHMRAATHSDACGTSPRRSCPPGGLIVRRDQTSGSPCVTCSHMRSQTRPSQVARWCAASTSSIGGPSKPA